MPDDAAKMVAPFVPFLAETMWQNLTSVFGGRAVESVHLCDYPMPIRQHRCAAVATHAIVAGNRVLRTLGSDERQTEGATAVVVVEVILNDALDQAWLEAHNELLREELNVKQIAYTEEGEKYLSYLVQPTSNGCGPRVRSVDARSQRAGRSRRGQTARRTQTTGSSRARR